MASHPRIRLDLTRQQLLIKPDDPLPRFHPPPKAIMVTPIYDYDVQIGLDETNYPKFAYDATDHGSSHPRKSRHSAAHAPSLMYYPTENHRRSYDSGPYDDRRHSQYPISRLSYISSYTNSDDHRAAHSDSDSYRGRRASSYSPPRRLRRRHSRDSYDEDSQGRDSRYDDEAFSSYPHSYTQHGQRTRERPPEDPIAQHTPSYQIQATHQGQGAVGHAPSHATEHSFGRFSQNTPYPFHPTGNAHSVGDRPPASPPPEVPFYPSRPGTHLTPSAPGGHASSRPGTQYAPSGGHVASRPGTHYAPSGGVAPSRPATGVATSVFGGKTAPSVMSASSGSDRLDDVIRSYLKLLPPHPHWAPSKLTGRKRAVCIGINYVGQDRELRGCFNDAKHMANFLISRYKFPADQVLLLTDVDSQYRLPTRKEMFNAFTWLVEGAQPNDSLFFHYSGHGGQSADASGREADGMDDTIFPVDFKKEGNIIDDELHEALVHTLPAGCRLTALFDSCHSGTVLDLPYLHSAHGRLRGLHHITARAKQRKLGEKCDVICFAACKDDETSADTFEGGVAVGAMSNAFVTCLEQNRHQSYELLLGNLRKFLVPKYKQKPQISGTNPLDLSREFAV